MSSDTAGTQCPCDELLLLTSQRLFIGRSKCQSYWHSWERL